MVKLVRRSRAHCLSFQFKSDYQVSVHAQNALVYCGMLLTSGTAYMLSASKESADNVPQTPWDGFDAFTGGIVVGEALGGMCMAYICKVYSSVTKVYAGCVVMAVVTVGSAILGDAPLTLAHSGGVALCAGALLAYQRKQVEYQGEPEEAIGNNGKLEFQDAASLVEPV